LSSRLYGVVRQKGDNSPDLLAGPTRACDESSHLQSRPMNKDSDPSAVSMPRVTMIRSFRPSSAAGWLSAALLLLLVMLAYFLYASYRQTLENTAVTTRNLVQVIEASLSDDFSRVDGLLGFMARELDGTGMLQGAPVAGREGFAERLARLRASFPKISALNVFDANGMLRYSSMPDVEDVSIAELDHFRRIRDDPEVEVAYSSVRVTGTTGRRAIAQARALRDDSGNFLGIVGAIIDLDEIAQVFMRIDVGQGGLALLRRSDDSTLIQRFPPLNEADFNQPLPRTNAIRQRIDAGDKSGTLTYTASTDGVDRIASFKVLDGFPFYVQVALAETEYLAGWWRSVTRIGVVAVVLLLGFGFAIVRLRNDERQLDRIAHYDALTALPNRVLLANRLEQAMVRAERSGGQLALCYLDLDGFKAVNDDHGHGTGDRLLVTLAQRMKECLREGDTVARLGGDEFVVVLTDLSSSTLCMSLVRRLIHAIDQPVEIEGQGLRVSSSVGVTFYPQKERVEADQLLRQADQAMYQAKLAGRNRFHVFDVERDELLRGQHVQLGQIRDAMDRQEFVLHYQPKVNMRTGAVVGAEALIRWAHPELGLLPPAAFLPVIEQHQLDVELGRWVLDTALAQTEAWEVQGLVLPVSVNVSAHFLQQADFLLELEGLLARHPDVPSGRLELEVLESSALSDIERASMVIESCSRLGVRVALDDFGTGYSSLSYLKRLPASVLKIDQSFVRDMLDDPDDLSILEGILGLAGAFRREVVAEGVETLEHGRLLLHLGCELAQGYGIARPMPAEQLPGWIATWRPDAIWTKARQLLPIDIPLLYAMVEHRAWIHQLEAFLSGARETPPEGDPHQCRFGQWIHDKGPEKPIGEANALHRQIHALANNLIALRASGNANSLQTGLAELQSLRDQLLGRLQALID